MGIASTAVALVGVIAAARSPDGGGTESAVVIAWVCVLAFAALAIYLLARRFEAPFTELREAAARLARGNLDFSFPPDRTDLLSDVVADLNRMAEQVRHRVDVLTRQRNEQQAILSGMVEAVVVLNTDLEIIEVNPAACRLIGMESTDAYKRPLIEVLRNAELYDFALASLSSLEPREASITISGPEKRYLQVHGTLLREQSGEIGVERTDRLVLVLNDITKLKVLENIRRDFVANVSHELKTPITSIKGFVETLRDGAIDDPVIARKFLAILEKQADRLHAIIEDLLSLSRLEQIDGRPLEIERVALAETIANAIQACEDAAAKKRITITVQCDGALTIEGNAILIEQAMINLVDNAVKYTPEGGSVTVSAIADRRHVDLVVEDTGIGIPQKDVPRIFERFYRVEKARSRELGGTGLGLSIVKHIALSHHGEVLVESALGEGSRFTLRLPSAER